MSIFGNIDAAEIDSDPFASPVGTWRGKITEVSQYSGKKDPNAEYLAFKISERGSMRSFTNQFQIAGLNSAEQLVRFGFLKAFLLALEFPESKMDEMTVESLSDFLVGVDVILTTKKNGQYTNISGYGENLEIRRDDDDSLVSNLPAQPQAKIQETVDIWAGLGS